MSIILPEEFLGVYKKDRKDIKKIKNYVDTIYGRQNELINSHNNLVISYNEFLKAFSDSKKSEKISPDVSQYDQTFDCLDELGEVINQEYYYTVEWGEYKKTKDIPAMVVVGDIIESNNIMTMFGNAPLVAPLMGFFGEMLSGKKKERNYSTARNFIDNSKASISHIYEDYTMVNEKKNLKDSINKKLNENEIKLNSIKDGFQGLYEHKIK